MPRIIWSCVVAALLLACAAGAQEAAPLRYAPEQGQSWKEKLSGDLLEVTVQGQGLGVTGFAEADVTATIVAVDAGAKTSNIKFELTNVQAELNGDASTPGAQEPLTFTVDEVGDMVLSGQQGQGKMDLLATGGVPLHIVNLLAHMIRFQEEAVSVGDEWEFEDTYAFPGMGDVPVNTRWKLSEKQGDQATVLSTAVASLPNFKAPNPMAPGTEMDVTAGTVTITAMKQIYDTKLSRVTSTEGTLRIEATVNLQGMQMPLAMTMKFTLEPAKAPVEPAR